MTDAKGPVLNIRANVRAEVGLRVLYDPPNISGEDFASDEFFRTNKGRYGEVAGFPTVYVGPCDHRGRLPGAYYSPANIFVRFDGSDEVHCLNIRHLILLSPVSIYGDTHEPRPRPGGDLLEPLEYQRAGDLLEPLRFYPGDVVRKLDDLLAYEHTVRSVHVNKGGTVRYQLDSGYEVHSERIALIRGGNVRWLYTDPEKLRFDSDGKEAKFWAQSWLTYAVHDNDQRFYLPWEFSLAHALEFYWAGKADLLIPAEEERYLTTDGGPRGTHTARRLHNTYAAHRERVRSLMQRLYGAQAQATA